MDDGGLEMTVNGTTATTTQSSITIAGDLVMMVGDIGSIPTNNYHDEPRDHHDPDTIDHKNMNDSDDDDENDFSTTATTRTTTTTTLRRRGRRTFGVAECLDLPSTTAPPTSSSQPHHDHPTNSSSSTTTESLWNHDTRENDEEEEDEEDDDDAVIDDNGEAHLLPNDNDHAASLFSLDPEKEAWEPGATHTQSSPFDDDRPHPISDHPDDNDNDHTVAAEDAIDPARCLPHTDEDRDTARNDTADGTTTTTGTSVTTSHRDAMDRDTPNDIHSTTETTTTLEKASPEPDMEDILTSTDALFEHVTDKTTVTVKDILQSLRAEYSQVTFTKSIKATIRSRLVELIHAALPKDEKDDDDDDISEKSNNVQSDVGDSDQSDESEADSDIDTDPEQSNDDDEDDDFTTTTAAKKKATTKSRTTKPSRSVASKTRARPLRRPKPPSAASTKLSLRVHAEQRRKRRLEELRVRNEELSSAQNAVDRERAEQIARKFATNTQELRHQRVEQRLSLLQKLNDKRLHACASCSSSKMTTMTSVVPPDEHTVVPDHAIPPPPPLLPESTTILQLVGHIDNDDEEEEEDDDGVDDDDGNNDDDDDDDELEIIGRPASATSTTVSSTTAPPATTGVLALLDMADANQLTKRHGSGLRSPGRNMDQRALLREKLKEKQRSLGNRWLARELGYKTEEEHLEVCLAEEKIKRERIYQKEQERIKANERAAERMMQAIDNEDDEDEVNEAGDGDAHPMDGSDNEPNEDENDDEDDDEEMAMARELESGEIHSEVDTNVDIDRSEVDTNSFEATLNHPEMGLDNSHVDGHSDDDPKDGIENAVCDQFSTGGDIVTTTELDDTDENQADSILAAQLDHSPTEVSEETQPVLDNDTSNDLIDTSTTVDPADLMTETETSITESISEVSEPKGPRNKGWKAILQQDAEKAKKKKRSQLVEEEADEEEEEEVAGLEDFGFVVKKKNGGDDEEDADLGEFDEDDLEHVVDDLSDDEGDELAGEKARKAMEAKEEKERHKEMLRRMRDGYDGRRGGIAGATGGARGFHRFDQLVAADNREDAKLLGLLNDDEIDSDNEEAGIEKGADNEEDDEHVLLDKMLKARFLHRSTVEEENFSEDDGDDDNNVDDEGDGSTDKVDEEEKEQERLAKRFAKRARMQRLIEVHGHEAEFSESKLIDEDTTLKLELQRMKNGLIRKQSDTTSNSWPVASSWSVNNISQQSKKQKTTSSVTFATSLLSKGGSLAIALQANRKSNKARTSFVSKAGNGGTTSSVASKASSSFQKCIAFNHVVFHSSNSNTASRSQSMKGGKSSSATGNGSNHKLSNVTNNRFVGTTAATKVSSNQDSLFSKLALTANQRKRKL